MALLDWFIFMVIFYVVVDFFCLNSSAQEEEERDGNVPHLTTVVVVPNGAQEDKPEDDLPPYTPPTPKTQAAMADLPPSYDETWDITESNINATGDHAQNTTYPNSNININNVNLPASYNVNTNIVPPANTHTAPVS